MSTTHVDVPSTHLLSHSLHLSSCISSLLSLSFVVLKENNIAQAGTGKWYPVYSKKNWMMDHPLSPANISTTAMHSIVKKSHTAKQM